MDRADYLATLRADGQAMADAARLGLDAPVPSCPGWEVADLLGHLGGIQRWATGIVANGAQAFPGPAGERPASREGAVDWFVEGLSGLLDALAAVDLDAPVWNFTRQNLTGAFWVRRQAQEAAVHRWDAQNAHTAAAPIDTALAVDGIAELLEIFVPRLVARSPEVSLGGTLHVHCTDTPGEWLLSIENGVADIRSEHAKGDAAVRGAASDLLLFLWNRVPLDALELFGDAAVAERWATVTV